MRPADRSVISGVPREAPVQAVDMARGAIMSGCARSGA